MEHTGMRLKELLHEKNMKQKELAELLGVNSQRVNQLINQKSMSAVNLHNVLTAAGWTAAEFFKEAPPEGKTIELLEKLTECQERVISLQERIMELESGKAAKGK